MRTPTFKITIQITLNWVPSWWCQTIFMAYWFWITRPYRRCMQRLYHHNNHQTVCPIYHQWQVPFPPSCVRTNPPSPNTPTGWVLRSIGKPVFTIISSATMGNFSASTITSKTIQTTGRKTNFFLDKTTWLWIAAIGQCPQWSKHIITSVASPNFKTTANCFTLSLLLHDTQSWMYVLWLASFF